MSDYSNLQLSLDEVKEVCAGFITMLREQTSGVQSHHPSLMRMTPIIIGILENPKTIIETRPENADIIIYTSLFPVFNADKDHLLYKTISPETLQRQLVGAWTKFCDDNGLERLKLSN